MIQGLSYLPEFVTQTEQENLLSEIDKQTWLLDIRRRTQHYGYKYDYTRKLVDSSLFLGPIPNWLQPYTQRLVDQKIFEKLPDQIIINEYNPGQGISRHVDCVPCFGDTIASLSLNSTCMMELEQLKSSKKGTIMLAPLSLLVLTGEARHDWMHSIPARKEDTFNFEVFPRQRRVSLTFRTVKLNEGQIPLVH